MEVADCLMPKTIFLLLDSYAMNNCQLDFELFFSSLHKLKTLALSGIRENSDDPKVLTL